MYNFFNKNDLISPNQSGFKLEVSCFNQLLSVNHELCKFLEVDYGVQGMFLDISKAFDKVWHEGFIFELKHNGISGKMINY